MVLDIWALGVNRLSIGVQSFDDEVLRILGRAHDAARAKEALAVACLRFDNVSIVLMCGIPGQSLSSLENSANTAVDMGIPHISMYPLTIEPHTAFDRAVLDGSMQEPDDDREALHMKIAASIFEQAGLSRYEVASYALPGYESKHNSSYWTGIPYLGIGQNATTMTQNDSRRMRIMNNEVIDDLDRKQMEAEDLMLGMRMTKGISDERLSAAAAYIPDAPAVFVELEQEGLCMHESHRWRPTTQGWLCGNELYGRILDLAP